MYLYPLIPTPRQAAAPPPHPHPHQLQQVASTPSNAVVGIAPGQVEYSSRGMNLLNLILDLLSEQFPEAYIASRAAMKKEFHQ